MSADNFVLVRPYEGGWLLTQESASNTWGMGPNGTEGNYSDPAKAFLAWQETVIADREVWLPRWVETQAEAERIVDDLYSADQPYIEYGPTFLEA